MNIRYCALICITVFFINLKARTIDPQTQEFLNVYCSQDLNLAEISLAQLRGNETIFRSKNTIPVWIVQDIDIHGNYGRFSLRMYYPEKSEKPLPIVIFLHGGGWVWGSLNSHDDLCREICVRAKVIVVAVDYHRAPEYKFPVAINDCYEAALWVADHSNQFGGDASRIGIMGDNAGGNLAAAVCLMARDNGLPQLCYQILMYPVLDYNFESGSYQENGAGYFLTTQHVKWFWHQYLADIDNDQNNCYATPLRLKDLNKLPPTLLVIAEFDPVRDNGLAYYDRLYEAGNEVRLTWYNSIHYFVSFADYLDVGKLAMREIIDYIILKNN